VKAAERQDAADAVTGTVTVDALGGTKELKSDLPGRVVWCEAIARTSRFKKGDKLVVLDSTDLARQIEDTKRNFEYASELKRFELTGGRPELLRNLGDLPDDDLVKKLKELSADRKELVRKLESAQRLLELNAASQQDVRSLEREIENLDNRLKRSVLEDKNALAVYQSTMASLNEQLRRMTIVAPADGQIDVPQTSEGALIGGGQSVALWFSNEREVAAKISEEDFGKVKLGQPANLRLLTYGNHVLEAEVLSLHPKADDAQRFTVFLKVKVEHPEVVLKPNSTGEVVITVEKRPNALVIQRRALFDSDKVYVVKNGRVEKRTVEVGVVMLNIAEIRKGLQEGEQVIVDNIDQFRDGKRVQVEVVK
jgi:RND family efflux transporter MFP subunit